MTEKTLDPCGSVSSTEFSPLATDYRRLIREDFERRMRAEGHGPTALTRLDCGIYLSPAVHRKWEAEKTRYAAPPDDWKRKAAAWLIEKAEEQEKTNAENPRHTDAYPSWRHRALDRRWLAEELLNAELTGPTRR